MIKSIISAHYFGNLHYFSKFFDGSQIVVDSHEHFAKQTFRNRCLIMGANGVLTLTVPTVKSHNCKIAMKDILVDYATSWQKQHLRSIESAYKNSPYFDYFFEHFEPIFVEREKYLFDLNIKTTQIALDILDIKLNIEISDKYVEGLEVDNADYRSLISPKSREIDPCYKSLEYYQVFSDKMDFEPNLSILDLLFCEGKGANMILKKSNSLSQNILDEY